MFVENGKPGGVCVCGVLFTIFAGPKNQDPTVAFQEPKGLEVKV